MAAASASERILEAALAEFADRGFDGASTTEIARRARVTQPLVHYHFASKEALWKAAVTRAFAELDGVLDGLAPDAGSPAERMQEMIRRYVRFAAAHPEMGRLMAREGARPGPRLRWLVRQHVRPLHDRVEALLKQAVRAGAARPLPIPLVALIVLPAATYPFMVPALVREVHGLDVADAETVDRHAETLAEVLLHGLAADAPGSGARGKRVTAPRRRGAARSARSSARRS